VIIPKVLHQIWVGPPMPEQFALWAEAWQELHPGWQYRLWNEENMPALANADLYNRASDLCPGFEGQLRSDVARYEILLEHGGVYLDVDFEPQRPLDGLLEGVRCFAAWEIQNRVANNAIFGAEPGHPFLRDLVSGLSASVLGNPGKRPSKVSGPHYMTHQLVCHPEVVVFDRELFYPYACDELHRATERFPKAYAIHHWNNQRRLRRKPLRAAR